MLLLLLALTALGAAAFMAFNAMTMPAQERRTLLRRAATYGHFKVQSEVERESFSERTLTPIKEHLARWVLKANPKMSVDAVNQQLMAAGLARRFSPTSFLALKGALTVGGVLFALLTANGPKLLLAAAVLGIVGYKGPDMVVTMKLRRRKEELRESMPDALDLLAVSVEAGLGFDAAILKLMEHMEGSLAEEFALTLGEMRMGQSRTEALKNLSDRTDLKEMASFTRAIIQADQLGISLGRILRAQAADTRSRRQAAAEEKAAKSPIKMLFPTAIFIFPAIFMVSLGPAFLNISKIF